MKHNYKLSNFMSHMVRRQSWTVSIKLSPTRIATAELSYIDNGPEKRFWWFARLIVPAEFRRQGIASTLMDIVEARTDEKICNAPNYYGEGDGEFYLKWLEKRGWKKDEDGVFWFDPRKHDEEDWNRKMNERFNRAEELFLQKR